MLWIGIGIVLIVIFIVGVNFLIPSISPRPENLGWQGNSFTACPGTPNCVNSTTGENRSAYVAPIAFSDTSQIAHDVLVTIINNMPRTQIITDDGTYIHAEFRSATMGFIDDTEFYIDADNGVIHVRSASRLGNGDMGVNRNRIESIREQFNS